MTERFQNKYRIPSARAAWHGYDGGTYFITICTKNREHYFGEIVGNNNGEPQMQLSEIGRVATDCMEQIHTHFPHVDVPLYVIMPNHIHVIIMINELDDNQTQPQRRDAKYCVSTTGEQPCNKFGPQSKNLASVIRGFKIGVTKIAHENNIEFAWQPRFHDRIVRDQNELNRIAEYIENNVANWQTDELNNKTL